MSAKLIIWLPGKPSLHGYKRREFLWSERHGCYLYGGAEIEASKFNEVYEKAFKTNADMNPRIKVLSVDAMSAAPTAPPIPAPPISPPAPPEITLEQAEEAMQRLAPERLKKKTGPKTAALVEV